jgi:hypothetical protein
VSSIILTSILGRLVGSHDQPLSGANWDSPLSMGYLTITISAILTAIMTLRTPQKGADELHQDHQAGSLTLA